VGAIDHFMDGRGVEKSRHGYLFHAASGGFAHAVLCEHFDAAFHETYILGVFSTSRQKLTMAKTSFTRSAQHDSADIYFWSTAQQVGTGAVCICLFAAVRPGLSRFF